MISNANAVSSELLGRAAHVLPGGNTRTSLYWPGHQLYAASARGSRLIDEDGIERVDLQNNFTALIHGHCHPDIVKAVREQVGKLMSVGMATRSEIELAEVIVDRVRSIDRIRFANSGTEGVDLAIKAARAYTGRPKIAKCEGHYHGASPSMELSVAPPPDAWGSLDRPAAHSMSKGTPQSIIDEVVILPFNDVARARHLLDEFAEDLACIVVDPIPVRAGMLPASPEFLSMLREFTRKTGSVLIFDEVLNFRLDYGGAQARFGCEPDLTALGKIIGGGLPIGAVGGNAELMSVFDPTHGADVWHGGTFNGNPSTMAAGLASMKLLTREALASLEVLGNRARKNVAEAFAAAGQKGQVTGAGSLLRIHCSDRPIHDYRSFYPSPAESRMIEYLMSYMFRNGFIVTRMGTLALSTANTEEEIDSFASTFCDALEAMKRDNIVAA